MKETVIQFNTRKQVIILLFAVGLATAIFVVGIYPMFLDHQIRFFCITFFLVSCWLVSKGLMSVFSKDKAGLIINSNGIHSKVTSVGKKIGFIPWEDVKRVGTTILLAHLLSPLLPINLRSTGISCLAKKERKNLMTIISSSTSVRRNWILTTRS